MNCRWARKTTSTTNQTLIFNVPANKLDRNGPGVTTSLALKNVATFDGTNYVDLFPNNGTLEFTGSKGADGGLDLATKSLTITDTTTVQDLINFMQQSLGIQITSPDPEQSAIGHSGRIAARQPPALRIERGHRERGERQSERVSIHCVRRHADDRSSVLFDHANSQRRRFVV